MTELLEGIAVSLAFGDDEFKCPFEHDPEEDHDEENKIPPDHTNSSGMLGTALKAESHHLTTAKITPPFKLKDGSTCDTAGYSPHHLIPGNEIWNDKGHPLHAWIHKAATGSKVAGDIGYVNNAKSNGVDLPSRHAFSGDWTSSVGDQAGYTYAAMDADTKKRQWHDSHKAYSDMVWNTLEKISTKLNEFADKKGCGKDHCPAKKSKPYDPPYAVVARLKGVAARLKGKVHGSPRRWKPPVMTSKFALMYKRRGYDQEKARQTLSDLRDKMGRKTGD